MFTTGHAWSESGVRALSSIDGISAVAVPGGHLFAGKRTVSRFEDALPARRTTLALDRDTADAQLVATSDGNVLLYRRLDRTARTADDDPDSVPGTLWLQRLDEVGRATGLALEAGAGEPTLAAMAWFTARWDAGRLVVIMGDSDDAEAMPHHAVVSLDGRVLEHGDGADVVCPLAGCVRLVGRTDPLAVDVGASEDGLLRLQLLAHGTSLATTLPADHVEVAAVSGDRVLVVARSTVEGAVERTVALVDVPRHRLVPVVLAESQQLTTNWTLPVETARPMVRATSTGFVLLYGDGAGRIVRQDLVCDP